MCAGQTREETQGVRHVKGLEGGVSKRRNPDDHDACQPPQVGGREGGLEQIFPSLPSDHILISDSWLPEQ